MNTEQSYIVLELGSHLFTCYRFRRRLFNSYRWQVETFASRKSGLRFHLYLLIWFLHALLVVDPNWTFVWCDGRRFTPFHAIFHGRHCLGYPLGLVGNDVKPKDSRYPIPLTLFLNLRSLPCHI